MPFGAIKWRFQGRGSHCPYGMIPDQSRHELLRFISVSLQTKKSATHAGHMPARTMSRTRRQEPIGVRRSSVRRSRGRQGGYQACVHALACKGLRLRANQLPQKRGFDDPACHRPALLWLRSCMPSHPRLVRMPHRFSTNGNNSRCD